jgi:uncharacterized coiled-coil protein SlyX
VIKKIAHLFRPPPGPAEFYARGEHIACLEKEIARLEKKAESDGALIESLNRYIYALEGKSAYQKELLGELRERLSGLLSSYNKEDPHAPALPQRQRTAPTGQD